MSELLSLGTEGWKILGFTFCAGIAVAFAGEWVFRQLFFPDDISRILSRGMMAIDKTHGALFDRGREPLSDGDYDVLIGIIRGGLRMRRLHRRLCVHHTTLNAHGREARKECLDTPASGAAKVVGIRPPEEIKTRKRSSRDAIDRRERTPATLTTSAELAKKAHQDGNGNGAGVSGNGVGDANIDLPVFMVPAGPATSRQ